MATEMTDRETIEHAKVGIVSESTLRSLTWEVKQNTAGEWFVDSRWPTGNPGPFSFMLKINVVED